VETADPQRIHVAATVDSELVTDVFLYYPIELLQAACEPQAEPWSVAEPSAALQTATAFRSAAKELTDAGIVPCLVDGRMLRDAEQTDNGLRIGRVTAGAIVYPKACEPPGDCRPPVTPSSVYTISSDLAEHLFGQSRVRFVKDNPAVSAGLMTRDSRLLAVLVNLTDSRQSCCIRTVAGEVTLRFAPSEIKLQNLGSGKPTSEATTGAGVCPSKP